MSILFLNSVALRQSLIRRFSVAMLVVLATTVGSLLAVNWQIEKSEQDGHLINISGRQRMLSQRIAVLSSQYSRAASDEARSSVRELLVAAIARMESAHDELRLTSTHSPSLVTLMEGTEGIDAHLGEFLNLARSVLNASNREAEEQHARLFEIAAEGELLAKLDQFVLALENNYDQKLDYFKLGLIVLAAISIVTLLIMAFAIYLPTTRLVTANLKRLEQSNTELMEFSYRISHDLRAPVVAALGIAEVARDALDDGDIETTSASLDRVAHSLNRVTITIQDIVSLIKQKMTDVQPESVLLSDLVAETVESVKNMPDFAEIDLNIDCPNDLEIETKRVYLKQTLENLISNAIKYRDPSEPASKVEIAVTLEGHNCRVSVADNGLGIDPAYRDKLFGMFQRFHPSVSFGTGLGLYLVSKNAEALDGSISYEPLEKGSRFDVSFPTLGA